jgi:hypothetical protein
MRAATVSLFVVLALGAAGEEFGGYQVSRRACIDEPFCPTELVLTRGRERHVISFGEGIEAPSTLTTIPVSMTGIPSPILVALAAFTGGSDTSFEIAVLRVKEGSVYELTDERLHATIQDALFLGTFDGAPGIQLLNFVWENEAHYDAHRYQAALYTWDGSGFRPSTTRETRRKHPDWRGATRELSLRCSYNFIERVLWDA